MIAVRRSLKYQGCYYLATGLWPILHLRSFAAIAGPKPDAFQTAVSGALYAATGATLVASTQRRRPDGESLVLSATVSAATIAITLRHVRTVRWTLIAALAPEAFYLWRATTELRRRLRIRQMKHDDAADSAVSPQN